LFTAIGESVYTEGIVETVIIVSVKHRVLFCANTEREDDCECENCYMGDALHILIPLFFICTLQMTKAVLIHEEIDRVTEIDVDIDPIKKEIFQILQGPATFIGQWPEIDVVILKCVRGNVKNLNTLPTPFDNESVCGKILLMRMDKESEPKDFTSEEYFEFIIERSSE
jgi:hypothetical protein